LKAPRSINVYACCTACGGLRLCPHFVAHHFTPALKTQLKQQGIARTLYDDTNLQALVNRCSRMLNRQFDCRDVHFCVCICSIACCSITLDYPGFHP
jgi:hypothetical protein